MKRVIIDTDPGIDDAAAILMALASPELEVVALTTDLRQRLGGDLHRQCPVGAGGGGPQ